MAACICKGADWSQFTIRFDASNHSYRCHLLQLALKRLSRKPLRRGSSSETLVLVGPVTNTDTDGGATLH